ncbi:MAG: hypothetical protein D6770_05465 [Anaerolineae bacterium]|nr:MAG: hypothetical protein D6770_05465 [Anaerolineae bacterium]
MQKGMLWFDNDPKTPLTVKVEQAARYYRRKYGRFPTLCLVHPTMLTDGQKNRLAVTLNPGHRIAIRPYRPILPNHLWIGVDEEKRSRRIASKTQQPHRPSPQHAA